MSVTIKAIVPKGTQYSAKMKSEFSRLFKDFGRRLELMLLQPTETWNNKPTFTTEISEDRVKVYTDQDHYVWTNNGTEQHTIAPRNVRFLKYRSTFRPKTQARMLIASVGEYSGSWIYRDHPIWHPGTAARHFDEVVAEIMEPIWLNEVQAAINAAVR